MKNYLLLLVGWSLSTTLFAQSLFSNVSPLNGEVSESARRGMVCTDPSSVALKTIQEITNGNWDGSYNNVSIVAVGHQIKNNDAKISAEGLDFIAAVETVLEGFSNERVYVLSVMNIEGDCTVSNMQTMVTFNSPLLRPIDIHVMRQSLKTFDGSNSEISGLKVGHTLISPKSEKGLKFLGAFSFIAVEYRSRAVYLMNISKNDESSSYETSNMTLVWMNPVANTQK